MKFILFRFFVCPRRYFRFNPTGSLLCLLLIGLPSFEALAQSAPQTTGSPVATHATDDLALRIQQVHSAEQTGDPQTIADANKKLIASALHSMGELHVLQGQYSLAIENFKRSLDFENSPDSRVALALAYMHAQRPDDALSEAAALILQDPKNADAWNIQGRLLMDKKEYARAADSLTRSLQEQPNPYVAYALGLAYLNLKQPDKASAIFDQLATSSGDSASVHILIGRAYQNTGMMNEAIAEFERAIQIDAKHSRGHYFLGLLYLAQNEWAADEKSRREFQAEIAENPDDFFGNFFMGYIESGSNNFDVSDRYLKVAAQAKPDWPEPWLYMGINAFGRGNNASAEVDMRKAIALTGTDTARNNYQIRRAYYILGRILIQRGQKEEGAADVKLFREMEEKNMEMSKSATPKAGMKNEPSLPTSAVIDPAAQLDAGKQPPPTLSPEEKQQADARERQLRILLGNAFNDLGTSEARRKEYDLALVHFQEAEKWNPEIPRLMRNIGLAAFRSGKYPEAVNALKTVVAADPQDKLALSMLAMSLYSADQYSDAVKAFDQMGDAAYSDPRIAYAWAYSLSQVNEPLKSSAVLEKLTAQPLSPDMLLLVGQVYNSIGDNVHGLEGFQKAAAADPNLKRAHYFAGLALIRLDRPNEAIPEFEAELKLTPDDPDTQYNLAFALLETSRRDQALEILRPLVQAHPNHSMAQYQFGKTLLDMGQVNEAIPHLEAAANANPNLDYVHYQLQMAYRKAGRTADADREARLYREIKDHKRAAATTAH